MAHFKGGRGKKVGYETQMYRIPTPMRPVVEKAGLQFRLLWDGLVDPTGEKLISRIEGAIADPEQLGESYHQNQISSTSLASKPDVRLTTEAVGAGHHNAYNQISSNPAPSVPDIKLTREEEESSEGNGHSLISSMTSSPVPDIKYQGMEKKLAEREEVIKALEQAASRREPQLVAVNCQLQDCLTAKKTMEEDWRRDRTALKDFGEEVTGLRQKLQEAAALEVKLRVENEELKAAQQNVVMNPLITTPQEPGKNPPPIEDPEDVEVGEAFSSEMSQFLEVTDIPSAETLDGLLSLGQETEEAAEGHASAPPSTESSTTTAPLSEASSPIVPQHKTEATKQPQSKGVGKVKPPSLRTRLMEALEEHKVKVGTDKLRELLGLPNDNRTRQNVTDVLGEMVRKGDVSRCKDTVKGSRTLYWIPSAAEKEAALKKLPSLSQVN